MPRFRRMLAPISSTKHYVQTTNTVVLAGAGITLDLVDAVPKGSALVDTGEVHEGSVVKAVFIELWINGQGMSATTQQITVLYKNPGGANALGATQALTLGAYTNKKNIFFASQGNLGDQNNQSVPIMRGWYLIPKGKQRFGLGDKLSLLITPVGEDIQICSLVTYKSYD